MSDNIISDLSKQLFSGFIHDIETEKTDYPIEKKYSMLLHSYNNSPIFTQDSRKRLDFIIASTKSVECQYHEFMAQIKIETEYEKYNAILLKYVEEYKAQKLAELELDNNTFGEKIMNQNLCCFIFLSVVSSLV